MRLRNLIIMSILLITCACEDKKPAETIQADNTTISGRVDSVSAKPAKDPFPSIKIGNQIWMTENLSVDTFRNGDPIRYAEGYVYAWDPVQYIYDNDPGNLKNHGRLYSAAAVHDPRGIAPEGWHIPSRAEWQELIDFLGGPDSAAYRLMVEWDYLPTMTPSGFNAIPSGFFGGYNNKSDFIGQRFFYHGRVRKNQKLDKEVSSFSPATIGWSIDDLKIHFYFNTDDVDDVLYPARCIKNDSTEMSYQYQYSDNKGKGFFDRSDQVYWTPNARQSLILQ